MMKHYANFSNLSKIKKGKKGQMKMQQMAFVLVAIIIFFATVALIYLSISLDKFGDTAEGLKQDEAKEIVKRIAGSPEFNIRNCPNCVDFDKVLALKDMSAYKGFWNLRYLAIEITYPEREKVECTITNKDNCNKITLIDSAEMGNVESAFVSVCRIDNLNGAYTKCEIGKIFASGEGI